MLAKLPPATIAKLLPAMKDKLSPSTTVKVVVKQDPLLSKKIADLIVKGGLPEFSFRA